MTISPAGLAVIKAFEGLYLKAYLCPGNVWTIGYGHTKGVKAGLTCTEAQADEWLRADMAGVERDVLREVERRYPGHRMTQPEFDALCSFCFNLGSGQVQLLMRVRAWADLPTGMLLYVKAAGRTLPGLVRRRAAESALFRNDLLAVSQALQGKLA